MGSIKGGSTTKQTVKEAIAEDKGHPEIVASGGVISKLPGYSSQVYDEGSFTCPTPEAAQDALELLKSGKPSATATVVGADVERVNHGLLDRVRSTLKEEGLVVNYESATTEEVLRQCAEKPGRER